MTASRVEGLEIQVLTLQRRLAEAEAKHVQAEQRLAQLTVETAIRDAAAKSGVSVLPSALPDVLKRASQAAWKDVSGIGLVKTVDGLIPDMDMSTGNHMTPANWLKSLAVEAPHLFQAAGDNAVAAGAKNPFTRENWSLTAQGELFKRDPALARKLAAEAGRA